MIFCDSKPSAGAAQGRNKRIRYTFICVSLADDFLINNQNNGDNEDNEDNGATYTQSIFMVFIFILIADGSKWVKTVDRKYCDRLGIGTAGSKQFHPINCFIYDRFGYSLSSRERTYSDRRTNLAIHQFILLIEQFFFSSLFGIWVLGGYPQRCTRKKNRFFSPRLSDELNEINDFLSKIFKRHISRGVQIHRRENYLSFM